MAATPTITGSGTLLPAKSEIAPATAEVSAPKRWEGRLFGGLVLAAFLLYGIGSALVEEPIGLALIMVNSVAVAVAGVIGYRAVGSQHPIVGAGYLSGRVAEAVLLAGGVALYAAADVSGADNTGYLLGMLALAVTSIPFCRELGRGHWLPNLLAKWGMVGYTALAAGALVELTTGRAVAIIFSIPGGLFEVALGLFLLRRGFGPSPR